MPEGTVLLRRSSLGDVVLLGSITAAVPRPVRVVTDPRYMGVAARLRGVDEVIRWGDPVPSGRVVDLQGSLASRRMAAASRRIRKRSLRRRLWLWWGGPAPRPDVPHLYAEAAGVRPRPPPWIDVPRQPRTALALVPGAAWEPKRARRDHLVACGEAWDGPVVVLGGPGEQRLVEELASALPDARPLVEEGFEQTLDALAGARVCVSGDTGLMHLAGAAGVPVVGLFGPTHPDDGFFVYPGEVVQRSLVCRPCTLHRVRRCRMGDLACHEVPSQRVVEAMRRCAG